MPFNEPTLAEVTAAAKRHMTDVLGILPHLLPGTVPTGTLGLALLHPLGRTIEKYALLRFRLLGRQAMAAGQLEAHAHAQGRIASDGNPPLMINVDPVVAIALLGAKVCQIDDMLSDLARDYMAAAEMYNLTEIPS